MLGWPSIAYPYLLQETSMIPISLSQSAMIAGFFMLGITTATPLSSKYHMGPKYGIWISKYTPSEESVLDNLLGEKFKY